jgi:hypothetical protein
MQLTQGELWLLDWVTSMHGETATPEQRDKLMAWRPLRERIWRAQLLATLATAKDVLTDASLDLTPAECEELLALLPVTFRWGTGDDVGFMLKSRLASELWGEEMVAEHESLKSLKAMFAPSPPVEEAKPDVQPNAHDYDPDYTD